MPHIVHVTVRHVQTRHYLPVEQQPVDLGVTATARRWQVLLRVDQSPVGIVAANVKKEKAIHIATTLASLLQMEMTVQS